MSDIFMTLPISILNRGRYRIGSRHKVAVSLKDLINQTNGFSKKYVGGCTPKLTESNPKEMYLRYRVTCTKADSDPNGHDVKLRFAYEDIHEGSRYDNLDVKVSCSCPAFLYWGAQWNSHKLDALEGQARPLLQAPTERLDLRSDYVICKHVKVVLDRVIPSVQRVINDKARVKLVEENKRRFKEEEEAENQVPSKSPVVEPEEYTQEDITPGGPEEAPEYTQEDLTEEPPEYTQEDLTEETPEKHTQEEKSKLPYDVDKLENTRKGINRDTPEETPTEETTTPVDDGQEEDQAKRKSEEEARKKRPRKPKPGEGGVEQPKFQPNIDQPIKKKPRKAPPKPVRPTDLPRARTRSGVID